MKKIISIILSVITLFSLFTIGVSAETKETFPVNIEGKGRATVIKINDNQVLCVQRDKPHPLQGDNYVLSETKFNLTDDIKATIIAVENYEKNDYRANVAKQCVFWAAQEGYERRIWCEMYSPDSLLDYDKITENAKTVDISKYDVEVQLYERETEPENYQKVVSVKVIKKEPKLIQNIEITNGGYINVIRNGNMTVFCAEKDKQHPQQGEKFVFSNEKFNLTDDIKATIIAINNYNKTSADSYIASQVAFWSAIEDCDYSTLCKSYDAYPNAFTICKEIMENAKTVDISKYNVEVQLYERECEPENCQKLASVKVSEIKQEITPTPEPEPEIPSDEPTTNETTPIAPKTGDSSSITFYLILIIISSFGIILSLYKMKKGNK